MTRDLVNNETAMLVVRYESLTIKPSASADEISVAWTYISIRLTL
jgi:hypothetical protein